MKLFTKILAAAVSFIPLALFVFTPTSTLYSQDLNQEIVVSDKVYSFLEALKKGDVNSLEALIGGDLSRNTMNLLRNNKRYPEFLRDTYADTNMEMVELTVFDQFSADALIQITYSSSESRFFLLKLRMTNDGLWKIVDQIEIFETLGR